ncbi:PAS domain-containing protein [Methylolobus aquaticus]
MKVPKPAVEEPAVGTVDENWIRTPPTTEPVAANELNTAVSADAESIAYLKSELERHRRLLSHQDEELRGLRESEKRLRDTLDHAPVLVFIKDMDGRYLFANHRCAELLNAEPGAIVGKTTDELFAPEVAAKLIANDRWVLSGQGCRQVEELLPVNGAWRTFLSSQFPLTDLDGNIYATCGISTDITERKRAATLNHKLAAIIEASSDLIATATPDGRIEYMNRAGRALLGIGATESLLHTTIEDYHPVWAYRRVVEAGVPAAFEFGRWQGDNAMLTRSGAEIPVSQMILAQKDAETGDLEFIATVCRDITERQRTEMALRKLQQEQELILDSVPAMIFYKDTANRLLRVNARVAEALGLPKDRIEGRHTSEFFPDEAERYYQDDLVVIRSGQPRLGIEEPIRVAADRVRWLSTDKVPLKDAAGKVTGVLVMATDITDRKLAEAALQDADRRKDEFLATLAHELRNPMAPIGNAVQILQTDGIDGPTRAWCCQLIERQVEHLTKLVDELLDISRITRGKISLDWQPVAVGDIVERALESCRPLLETYRHQLDLRLPSAAVYVAGDRVRLAQVVSNLLNNAAKYTEPGGHITLTVEHGDEGVTIRVRDDGIGIPPALLSQVFEMFTQGDQSLEKAQGGLGIGLSLARELVALHHGWIQAYSAGAGQGSEFVVWLPAASPPSEPAPAVSEAAPAPSAPRRVLVADDNQDAGNSLAALLRALGHEVHIARDGLEAVAAAEAHRPEFILMDIGMPRLNGYDACRRIREHAWGRDIVITALTGWGQDSDRQRSQEAGFSHHLTKPVDFNALRQLIDTLPSTA